MAGYKAVQTHLRLLNPVKPYDAALRVIDYKAKVRSKEANYVLNQLIVRRLGCRMTKSSTQTTYFSLELET